MPRRFPSRDGWSDAPSEACPSMGNDRFVDLLRHGTVVGGERFRGAADDRLSARGFDQMRAALAGLGREAGGHSPPYDALFSSPARRCAEPARELAARHGLPLELLPELGERWFGAWENRLADELPSAELKRFWDDPAGFTPPGAEPFEALRERVLRGWDRILGQRTDFPLVVTHGGVIRVILGQILDLSAAALMWIEVPPACRTRLRVPGGEGRPSLMFHGGAEPCGAAS
ncbi:histidine phosphatase family protein [Candidatus Thiosymbion oneisti]|uniref:histidine phosphatase family protein n=1 Tax=Candidatus Thiosymbion oneisti TaxID=589554 RepID=UPI0021089B33|nr:histidine phosphatase family protein [Candidatus Thiosymbion oneisti]